MVSGHSSNTRMPISQLAPARILPIWTFASYALALEKSDSLAMPLAPPRGSFLHAMLGHMRARHGTSKCFTS